MSKIIRWIKRTFWYTILIDVEKYQVWYWKLDETTIKEIEKMYKNTISELYLHWYTDAAKVVARDLSSNFIQYNKLLKAKKR